MHPVSRRCSSKPFVTALLLLSSPLVPHCCYDLRRAKIVAFDTSILTLLRRVLATYQLYCYGSRYVVIELMLSLFEETLMSASPTRWHSCNSQSAAGSKDFIRLCLSFVAHLMCCLTQHKLTAPVETHCKRLRV